jgi:DNA polymerase-3 subunit delta
MVITLTGNNAFALKSDFENLVNDFVIKNGELSVEHIDAEEANIERLKEAFSGLSLFSDNKLSVIRDVSKNRTFSDVLGELITSYTDANVVIVEPKIDKRSSIYKLLKRKTDLREFKELDSNGLVKWLSKSVEDRAGSINNTAARYLIERIGLDQLRLSNEIEKLLIYDTKITKETVDLMTEESPQSTIFQLIESVFNSDHKRTIALYNEQKELKVDPQQIMAMLVWQLHILAVLKTAQDKTLQQIASEARLSPYTLQRSQNISRRVSTSNLKRIVSDLVELDLSLKSRAIDADLALQHYLLSI